MSGRLPPPPFVQEVLYLRDACAFLLFSCAHAALGEQDSGAPLSLTLGVCYSGSGSVTQQKCVSVLELRTRKPAACRTSSKSEVDGLNGLRLPFSF